MVTKFEWDALINIWNMLNGRIVKIWRLDYWKYNWGLRFRILFYIGWIIELRFNPTIGLISKGDR